MATFEERRNQRLQDFESGYSATAKPPPGLKPSTSKTPRVPGEYGGIYTGSEEGILPPKKPVVSLPIEKRTRKPIKMVKEHDWWEPLPMVPTRGERGTTSSQYELTPEQSKFKIKQEKEEKFRKSGLTGFTGDVLPAKMLDLTVNYVPKLIARHILGKNGLAQKVPDVLEGTYEEMLYAPDMGEVQGILEREVSGYDRNIIKDLSSYLIQKSTNAQDLVVEALTMAALLKSGMALGNLWAAKGVNRTPFLKKLFEADVGIAALRKNIASAITKKFPGFGKALEKGKTIVEQTGKDLSKIFKRTRKAPKITEASPAHRRLPKLDMGKGTRAAKKEELVQELAKAKSERIVRGEKEALKKSLKSPPKETLEGELETPFTQRLRKPKFQGERIPLEKSTKKVEGVFRKKGEPKSLKGRTPNYNEISGKTRKVGVK